ncbi:MAG: hemH [Rickettsiales bacterium]|jgi:ferrochelatase|nr:hemH [Rickettsiales bacterium]
MNARVAVVLFNLGGPDCLESVKPFLFNLFSDKAIIALPQPFRFLLAKIISRGRNQKAQAIYQEMGGRSPILPLTQAQAQSLEAKLGTGYRVFVSMRYWHPMSKEVVKQVKTYQPDRVILLPLYPQFSTTTTGSSLDDWNEQAKAQRLDVPTQAIGCYPQEPAFIEAYETLLRPVYEETKKEGNPRILFSAHGLPEKIVKAGDPYQWQVEQTVAAIVKRLNIEKLDYAICYQSRVGPLAWIGPSLGDEIARAGKDNVPVVVVPVAFVSEHSETLVELDIEYRKKAEEVGIPYYARVPALGVNEHFIASLASLCLGLKDSEKPISRASGGNNCPAEFGKCVCAKGE